MNSAASSAVINLNAISTKNFVVFEKFQG